MTDAAVTNIEGSSTDKIINFINDQIHTVANSIQQYGPVAVNSIGKVKQFQAIGTLVSDVFIILFMLGFVSIGIYLINKAFKKYNTDGDTDDPVFICCILGGGVLSVLGMVFLYTSVYDLADNFPCLLISISSPDNAFVWYIINDVIPHLKK